MKSRTVFFTNLLLWVFLVLAGYFIENTVIFSSSFSRHFTFTECSFLFIGLIGILVSYLYLEKKYNGFSLSKVEIIFAGFVLFLIATNIALILSSPEASICQFTATSGIIYYAISELTFSMRFYYCLASILAFSIPFILVFVLPRKFFTFKQYDFMYYLILLVAAFSIIFSLVFEFGNYLNFFTKLNSLESSEYAVHSFLFNRNIYGLFLFISVFACAYLNSQKPHWYYYVFMILLFTFMFFTLVKTTLALCGVFLLVYTIYRLFITLKFNKTRNITLLFIILLCFLGALALFVISNFVDIPFLLKVNSFVKKIFINIGESTISSRIIIWQYCLMIVGDPLHAIFGRGIGVFEYNLYSITSSDPNVMDVTSYAHNSILDLLGKGGIIYVLFYLALLIYGFYCLYKMRKFNKSLAFTNTLFAILILVAGMIECWYFFSYNISNIVLTVLVFLPAFSYAYHQKHPSLKQNVIINAKSEFSIPSKSINMTPISSFCINFSPLIGSLIGMISIFVGYSNFSINSVYLIIAQLSLLLLAVLPLYLIIFKSNPINKTAPNVRSFYQYLIVLGSCLIIFAIPSFSKSSPEFISFVIAIVCVYLTYYSIMSILSSPFFPLYKQSKKIDDIMSSIVEKQIKEENKI